MNEQPFLARGHQVEPPFASVRINPEARGDYASLVADTVFAEGTLVSLFYSDELASRPGPVYAAEKHTGAWRFFVTDEHGRINPDVDVEKCRRCHEGAPGDALFGLPTPLR